MLVSVVSLLELLWAENVTELVKWLKEYKSVERRRCKIENWSVSELRKSLGRIPNRGDWV